MTNADLGASLETARAAWASCAAQIDMIAACQASVTGTEAAPHE